MPKKNKEKLPKVVRSPLIFLLPIVLLILLGGSLTIFKALQASNLAQPPKPQLETKATSSATVAPEEGSVASATKAVKQPTQSYGRSVRVPILIYHYIGNNPNPQDTARYSLSVPPDKFEQQMQYLADNGYNSITLDTLYAVLKGQAALPARPVVITFDDGYIDFYVNAFPILRRFNLRATEFIPTGLMNQGYYLSWVQIKEMDSTGLISFQSHTVTHAYLPSLPINQVQSQLTASKKVLEAQLGKPVNFFAYPYGATNNWVVEEVKRAGYAGAVGTWYGTVESEGNIFNMPRVRVGGSMSLQQFANRL